MTSLLASLFLAFPAGPRAEEAQIRSDRWKSFDRGERLEYAGNVRYRKGAQRYSAQWASIERPTGLWKARGKIAGKKPLRDGGRLEFSKGERGEHREGATGWLEGGHEPLHFTLFSDSGTYKGKGRRASWDEASRTVRIEGDARIHGPKGFFQAQQADFSDPDKTLLLTGRRPSGRVVENGTTVALQGDSIRMRQKENKLEARGQVRGWILPATRGKP